MDHAARQEQPFDELEAALLQVLTNYWAVQSHAQPGPSAPHVHQDHITPELEVHRAQLLQSAATLQPLLTELLASAALPSPATTTTTLHPALPPPTTGTAHSPPPSPPPPTPTALPPPTCSTLLGLPNDVLTRVARLAGRTSRLVCTALCVAYGLPSANFREPSFGYEPELNDCPVVPVRTVLQEWCSNLEEFAPEPFDDIFGEEICMKPTDLDYLLPSFDLGPLKRWGPQITRLELSSAHAAGVTELQQIYAWLHRLRELQCCWEDHDDASSSSGQILPAVALTALTGLTLLCGTGHLLYRYLHPSDCQQFKAAWLLLATPQLCSLRLDLRHQSIDHDDFPEVAEAFEHALKSLEHLTHLWVAFDQDMQENPGKQCSAVALLKGLLKRERGLPSLAFGSPPHWLGDELPDVLEAAEQLTRLSWPVGSACRQPAEEPDSWPEEAVLPRWRRMGGLRSLMLGDREGGWAAYEGDQLQQLFLESCEGGGGAGQQQGQQGQQRGQGGRVLIDELLLPVMLPPVQSAGHDQDVLGEAPARSMRSILGAVQLHFGALTSLQLGCITSTISGHRNGAEGGRGGGGRPPLMPWLGPVRRMERLRQLAVVLDEADLGQLSRLAELPHLTRLHLHLLHVCWGECGPSQKGSAEDQAAPARALGALTGLLDLALGFSSKKASQSRPCRPLLEAVAGLPLLQVLDTWNLVLASAPQQWAPLVRQPPPLLRLVVLRVDGKLRVDGEVRVDGELGVAGSLAAVTRELRNCMPGRVRVEADSSSKGSADWGPKPWSLWRPSLDPEPRQAR